MSPRVRLAVDVAPGVTPFVGWGRGFRAPQGVAANFSFFTIGEVAIERNEQIEVGVRLSDEDLGHSGSIAVYQLTRDDAAVLATIGAQAGVLDVADQRSRGVEVDALWRPTEAWKVLANYAYTDAEIVDADSPFKGNQLQSVPKHAAVSLFATTPKRPTRAAIGRRRLGVENLFDNEAFVPNFFFRGDTAPRQPLTVAGKLRVKF